MLLLSNLASNYTVDGAFLSWADVSEGQHHTVAFQDFLLMIGIKVLNELQI